MKIALGHNGPALIGHLESEQRDHAKGPAKQKAIEKLLTYLRPNRDRMWCADRLRHGQTIGSGQIEGGCKNTIGARLKLNNARWRVRRAERMGALRCVEFSALCGLTSGHKPNHLLGKGELFPELQPSQ